MKAKRLLCAAMVIVVTCIVLPAGAYAAAVSGKVLNESGEPMPAVTVILPVLEIGAFTDESACSGWRTCRTAGTQ